MGDHRISRPEDSLRNEPPGTLVRVQGLSKFEHFMAPHVDWESPPTFNEAFDRIAREQQDFHDAFENTVPD
jgi:hypothetical protein